MPRFTEISTKREKVIGYVLLIIVALIIASGLSTLFISYNLGLFIIDNVPAESLQTINKGIRLKYQFIQKIGGLEQYFKYRAALLATAIIFSGGLVLYLHIRLIRILKNYDQLRAATRQMVKSKAGK